MAYIQETRALREPPASHDPSTSREFHKRLVISVLSLALGFVGVLTHFV